MICQTKTVILDLQFRAPVAQRLEQQTHNLLAVGSNPTGGTKKGKRQK